VAEIAIGLDQALHALGQQAHRGAAGDGRDRRDRRRAEDAARKGRRWNQRRLGAAVLIAARVEALEDPPPGRVDAGGILQKLKIQILGEPQVRDRQRFEPRGASILGRLDDQIPGAARRTRAIEIHFQHIRHRLCRL